MTSEGVSAAIPVLPCCGPSAVLQTGSRLNQYLSLDLTGAYSAAVKHASSDQHVRATCLNEKQGGKCTVLLLAVAAQLDAMARSA